MFACFRQLIGSYQLVHGRMCWAASLFPKMSQEDSPVVGDPTRKVAWIKELNFGIQEVLREMPTPTWSVDVLRRIQQLGEGTGEP